MAAALRGKALPVGRKPSRMLNRRRAPKAQRPIAKPDRPPLSVDRPDRQRVNARKLDKQASVRKRDKRRANVPRVAKSAKRQGRIDRRRSSDHNKPVAVAAGRGAPSAVRAAGRKHARPALEARAVAVEAAVRLAAAVVVVEVEEAADGVVNRIYRMNLNQRFVL